MKSRPRGLTTIGILTSVIGLGYLAIGILATYVIFFAWWSTPGAILALGFLLDGILVLLSAVTFFRGPRWGWALGLFSFILSIVLGFGIITINLPLTEEAVLGIPLVILGVAAIFYLGRPSVRRFFLQD